MTRRADVLAFRVTLHRPRGATIEALRAYVEDAVASMKGSYCPEDPIFDLDGDKVRACLMKAPNRRRKAGG